MPQIGWFELLIIIVVAVLIIGPKDFPIVLKKIGTWTKSLKRYFSEVQNNLSEITNISDDKLTSSKEKKNKDKKNENHPK